MKEILQNSIIFLKNGKHWKRVTCLQVICISIGIRIMCVLVGWGRNGRPLSVSIFRPWSHTINGLLFLFTFPFCHNFPKGEVGSRWIFWAKRAFGYLLIVTLAQIFLDSLYWRPHLLCASAWHGPACYLPWVPAAQLKGNLFHMPRALFTQFRSVPVDAKSKSTLDRSLLWKC